MLVVKVELHSAITGRVTEIARMMIHNIGGGSRTVGHYGVEIYRGRDAATLGKAMRTRKVFKAGAVMDHPRQAEHVWNLVRKALSATGYDKPQTPDPLDAS